MPGAAGAYGDAVPARDREVEQVVLDWLDASRPARGPRSAALSNYDGTRDRPDAAEWWSGAGTRRSGHMSRARDEQRHAEPLAGAIAIRPHYLLAVARARG